MIKLCLLGNSHAAAFKFGWDIVRSNFPGCDLTVFAAPAKRLDGLRVEGSRLVPDTISLRQFLERISGVAGHIEVGDYDRFLVACGRFNAGVLAGFLVNTRLDSEPKDARQPLSSPLFARMAEAYLRAGSAILTVKKLRQITNKPIGIIPLPLRFDKDGWRDGEAILGTETPQKLADCFAAAARMIADSLNCEIFWQPEATKSEPLHTNRAYSKGAVILRDNRPHGSDNRWHTNAEYGALMWRVILANRAWSGGEALPAGALPIYDTRAAASLIDAE